MADDAAAARLTEEQIAGSTTTEPMPAAAPISGAERFVSMDILRGVALLGILVMNIPGYALSESAYMNPTVAGGFEGINRIAWLVAHFIFDQKMMAIFSMLFGAGVIVMTTRAEAKGVRPGRLHYKRMGWLLVFGLIHAYFLWYGDILVMYALCGMLIYPLRRLRAKWLIAIGLVVTLIAVPINVGSGYFFGYARDEAAAGQAAIDAGEEPTEMQQEMMEFWAKFVPGFHPDEETLAEEENAYRQGGAELFQRRAMTSVWMQTQGLLIWGLWRAGGVMLIGMGLFKLGVFSARLPLRTYLTMAGVGYALGLPIIALGAERLIAHKFDVVYMFQAGIHFNYIGSLLVALAHVGLVMALVRLNALGRIGDMLGAVGRMAFTNYIMHSLICTTLFYGYGFGLWGKLDRIELLGVVAAIWAFQLLFSPWWLARFRFGPLEWLWRTLTYRKRQPMRRALGPSIA